jgi:hypothetical protein
MRGRRNKVALMSIVVLLFGLFATPTAHAAPGGGELVIRCFAKFPFVPGHGVNTNAACNGVVTGELVTTSGGHRSLWDAPISLNIYEYYEPWGSCPFGGYAWATFSINGGAITGSISWTRFATHVQASLTNVKGAGLTTASGGGSGVLFAPDMVNSCNWGGPVAGNLYLPVSITDTT